MIWLLDVALVVLTMVLLGCTGLAAWRKARAVLSSAADLRFRVEALSAQATDLGARLDAVEVNTRLSDARAR
ncbi:MAG: hypothetical protein ACQSGP_19180 [Frankia sp.]